MSVKRVQVVDQRELVRQQRPGQPAARAATEGADEERPGVAGYSMGVLAHIGPAEHSRLNSRDSAAESDNADCQ